MQEPSVREPEVESLHPEPAEQPAANSAPDGPPLLTRDMSRRMLGGVCAGIARTYDYDVTVVRVVALLLTLPGGFGIVLYAALWALMPADTSAPRPAPSVPTSNAEDLAERIRLAADELAAATRAAAEAARVATEQLAGVDRTRVPPRRVVVSFEFDDLERRLARWWLVISPDEVDVCDTDPGDEPTARVRTSLRTLTEVWRGDRAWSAVVADGSMQVHAPTDVARALPGWFLLSPFAGTPRPVS